MSTIAETRPSVAALTLSNANRRIAEVDVQLAQIQARIDSTLAALMEHEDKRAQEIAHRETLESQRRYLQEQIDQAQLMLDMAEGSGDREQTLRADLESLQATLASHENFLHEEFDTRYSEDVDYQSAKNKLASTLQVEQAQHAQLLQKREAVAAIRADAFAQCGLEAQAALMVELDQARDKEARAQAKLDQAVQARKDVQASIAARLIAWPDLARETERLHGEHPVSLRTSLLEQAHRIYEQAEANSRELLRDVDVLERFIDMRECPIPPITAYGTRAAFSHLTWDRVPGPISRFNNFMDSLASMVKQWHDLDEQYGIDQNIARAASQQP